MVQLFIWAKDSKTNLRQELVFFFRTQLSRQFFLNLMRFGICNQQERQQKQDY